MLERYFLLNDYTIDQVIMRNCGDVCGKKTGWHKAEEKQIKNIGFDCKQQEDKNNEIH